MRRAGVIALAGSLVTADACRCYPRDLNSVQELVEECSRQSTSHDPPSTILRANADQQFCFGYISGMAEMMGMNGVIIDHNPEFWSELHGYAMCPTPPSVPYGALVQAFKNYASAHREIWGNNKLVGVIEALTSVWPCRKP